MDYSVFFQGTRFRKELGTLITRKSFLPSMFSVVFLQKNTKRNGFSPMCFLLCLSKVFGETITWGIALSKMAFHQCLSSCVFPICLCDIIPWGIEHSEMAFHPYVSSCVLLKYMCERITQGIGHSKICFSVMCPLVSSQMFV